MAISGQLWFVTEAGDNENTEGDDRVVHVNSDGSSQTTLVANSAAHPSALGDYPVSIAIDPAAGLYFELGLPSGPPQAVNFGGQVFAGHLSSGSVPTSVFTQSPGGGTVIINGTSYTTGLRATALAIDTAHHVVYLGVGGTGSPSSEGIEKLTYNPVTGAITNTGFLVTAAQAGLADPTFGTFNPEALSYDANNNTVYFVDQIYNPALTSISANEIYAVNGSGTTTALLNQSQFPLDASNGQITGLAVDAADGRIYFTTTPYPGHSASQNAIWEVSTAGGTATKLTGITAGIPYSLAYDPNTNSLIVNDQTINSSSSTSDNTNILVAQLAANGLSVTAITTTINVSFNTVSNQSVVQGLDFAALPTIGTLTGTSSKAIQAGTGVTLLQSAPAGITDPDSGGFLASATAQITNAQSGDKLGIGTTFTYTTTPTEVSAGGGSFEVSYDNSTHTLSIVNATGVENTIAEYQTILGEVSFEDTSLGDTTAARDITWQINDGGAVGNPAGTTNVDTTTVDVMICFLPGTRILTDRGEVRVEKLQVGDTIVTLNGRTRRLCWIGQGQALTTRGRRTAATPVIVRKGALADNVPNRDLHVTKGHSLYLDDVLIPVEFLVNHRSIIWDDRAREVTAFHLELDAHDVLIANGAPAESYCDDGNRWLFRNANNGWDQPAKPTCSPVLTGGQIVDAVWRRLLDRSGPRPGIPLTEDPDLHLLMDGRRLDCTSQHGAAHSFALPDAPVALRIVSRAGSPEELGLARDPRMLGIALRRLALLQGKRIHVTEAENPSLTKGFHAFEPDNGLRWTDGDAELPAALFEGFEGPMELVLHVGCTTQYPLFGESARATAA